MQARRVDWTLPLVTVVVPVYNAAAYLDECLQSVATQTYEGPIEVSIYDDGSEVGPPPQNAQNLFRSESFDCRTTVH